MDPAILGFAAGALTSTAFVPQIWRGLRTRRLVDVSPLMLAVMAAGLSLWFAYGVARQDLPIIVSNAVGLTSVLVLALMRWRWGRAVD